MTNKIENLETYDHIISGSSKSKINIILAEDNVDDVDLMIFALNKSDLDYELTHVDQLDTLHSHLNKGKFDLVISDYDLKTFNGMDVIQKVRSIDSAIPIIIASGTVGEEEAVRLMKEGASDFFLKENIHQIPKEIIKILKAAENRRTSLAYKEKLEAQFNIFDTLMNSIEDFIFLKNDRYEYLKVNPAMCSYFGVSELNFEGKTDEQLGPGVFSGDSVKTDKEVFEYGRVVQFDLDFIDGLGQRKVFEIVKTPILVKGAVEGLVGVSRDITEKKLIDEELSKSQLILNQAESITSSGSFQYNPEIDLITCSQNFSSLMGLPNSSYQFSLKKLTMLVYSADRELFIESLERAIESHEEFDMEFRYVTMSNQVCYCRMKLSPDPSTDMSLFYGMIVDITSDRLNDLALQKAQENERKRVAMELHDNIGQKLSAAKMYLDQIRKQECGQPVFQNIYELIHESVSDTRNISRELSTKLIEENGLSEAINQLLNRLPQTINIDAEINIENATIDGFVGGNIFRIIQEAINNTLKYANARNISLQLYQNSEFLELILKDDGVGFDFEEQIRRGNGLKNIQQRVKTCNGLLRIESNPGQGTTILTKIPPK